MSPAATRRYVVRFLDWTMRETVVLAGDKYEAVEKAQYLYEHTGLRDFRITTCHLDNWFAEIAEPEIDS